jgi:hypothetical protein
MYIAQAVKRRSNTAQPISALPLSHVCFGNLDLSARREYAVWGDQAGRQNSKKRHHYSIHDSEADRNSWHPHHHHHHYHHHEYACIASPSSGMQPYTPLHLGANELAVFLPQLLDL